MNLSVVAFLTILASNLIFAGEITITFDELPCNQNDMDQPTSLIRPLF